MKKLSLLITGLFLLSVNFMNAQLFVGGSISLNSSGGKTEVGSVSSDKTKTTTFTFNPKAGYFLNDKFAAGASLMFYTRTIKAPGTPGTTTKQNTFGIAPFVRYYAVQFNKFSIYGEGSMGVYFGSQKSETGGTTTDGPKSTTFMIAITPALSYELTDKISLEANINLLNISYSVDTEKDELGNGTKTKDVTSNFSFGAGTNNIVNTGAISIGAIFKL